MARSKRTTQQEIEQPTQQPETVVEQVIVKPLPEPGERRDLKTEVITAEVATADKLSKDTIFFFLYLQLKSHQITRVQLKSLLNLIQSTEVPSNVAKFLVEEAAKA